MKLTLSTPVLDALPGSLPAPPSTLSNQQRSIDNVWKLMRWLGSFGYLSTPQVGAWFWPQSNRNTQYNSAKALCRRAREMGYVSKRTSPSGATAWVLSKTGAVLCGVEYATEAFAHGMDLGLMNTLWDDVKHQLLRSWCRAEATLVPIGQHGLRHNLLGLGEYRLFDAVLHDTLRAENRGVLVVTDKRPTTLARVTARARQRLPLLIICPDHIATVFEALDITAEVYPVDGHQLQLTGPVELTFKAWAPWPKEAQAGCHGG